MPGAIEIVEGVLPTNAPSISISAPGGVEEIFNEASGGVNAFAGAEGDFTAALVFGDVEA